MAMETRNNPSQVPLGSLEGLTNKDLLNVDLPSSLRATRGGIVNLFLF